MSSLFTRRRMLIAIPAILAARPGKSQAPLQPLLLHVVRDTTLPQTLNLSDCISGKLYHGSLSVADPGQLFCRTLELPFRSDQNKISAIKSGVYSAKVRTDGPLGWRIEFLNTQPRTVVEMHVGNRPKDTEGCILLGKTLGGPASITGAANCAVGSSREARDALIELYGNNNSRPVQLKIE
jgi:hypothetical protein